MPRASFFDGAVTFRACDPIKTLADVKESVRFTHETDPELSADASPMSDGRVEGKAEGPDRGLARPR